MNLDLNNSDKLASFVTEAKRMGIPILPPAINISQPRFSVETVDADMTEGARKEVQGRGIRYGLAAMKNVGEQAMAAIVAERTSGGAFETIYDLGERVDPQALNKRMLENMVRGGALDGLNQNRAQTLEAIPIILRASNEAKARKESQIVSLFDDADLRAAMPPLPDVKAWSPLETLKEEETAFGYYLTAHPLDLNADDLAAQGVQTAAQLLTDVPPDEGRRGVLAGLIVETYERRSKRGKVFLNVRFTDQSGPFEVSFFDETIAKVQELALRKVPIVMNVSADILPGGDRVNLTARTVAALGESAGPTQRFKECRIDCPADPEVLGSLKTRLAQFKQGGGQITLHLRTGDDDEVTITLPHRVELNPAARSALADIPGVRYAALA